MIHAVARTSLARLLPRLAAALTLASVSVGGFPAPTLAAISGSQLWVSFYDDGVANALGVSPDGSAVFVTGSGRESTNNSDFATVAYDTSTGAILWAKGYNGTGNSFDYANALGVSPDGSEVIVTGPSRGPAGDSDYATVAYDASTGAKLWARRYSGAESRADVANALGVSPDGSEVFVTGSSRGSAGDPDYATVAYDTSNGAKLWARRYNGRGNGSDIANALGVSPDGSEVYVTGLSLGSTSSADYATVAYDASTGAALWTKRYNGTGNGFDMANALGVSPDGSEVFVTGPSRGSTSDSDFATVAYDASTGDRLWAKRYDDGSANALGVSPDGSMVFVTGPSLGSTSSADYATVAYDASTGAKLWAKRYNGPTNGADVANALGVSPDGSEVFVTGYSHESTSDPDYATVAYDASTGARLWAKRFRRAGNSLDVANALGVNPDGSEVFVTGYSWGSTDGFNHATVAYGIG
jgi:hypothetical protein